MWQIILTCDTKETFADCAIAITALDLPVVRTRFKFVGEEKGKVKKGGRRPPDFKRGDLVPKVQAALAKDPRKDMDGAYLREVITSAGGSRNAGSYYIKKLIAAKALKRRGKGRKTLYDFVASK